MNEEETRKHAELQVETFLAILRERYGLSDADVSQLADDLVGLHRRAIFAKKMGEWTAQAIIAVLVAAFFGGLAWAFVRFLEDHSK